VGNIPFTSFERRHLQVLDIVMKHTPASMYREIGGAYYDEYRRNAWAQTAELRAARDLELWLGYRQTIVHTDSGPMMQIDKSACTVLKPVGLVNFIANNLKRSADRLSSTDFQAANKQVTKKGGLKVIIGAKHTRREYQLREISTMSANEATFVDNKQDGATVTVAAWFAKNHPQHPLRRPDWPVVCVGPTKKKADAIMLPIELCSLVKGQVQREMTGEIQAEMITATCVEPTQRWEALRGLHSGLRKGPDERGDQTATSFGAAKHARVAVPSPTEARPAAGDRN